jgi:hypothetical protein
MGARVLQSAALLVTGRLRKGTLQLTATPWSKELDQSRLARL